MQIDIFDEFSTNADMINFTVNLNTLLSCLNLHGTSQSSDIITATFYYSNEEEILKVTMEESGILSVCEINVLDMSDDDDPGLFNAFQVSFVILKTYICLYTYLSYIYTTYLPITLHLFLSTYLSFLYTYIYIKIYLYYTYVYCHTVQQ